MEWGAAACPTMGSLPTAGHGHVGTEPLQVVPHGAEGLAPPQGARPRGGRPRLAWDVHDLGVHIAPFGRTLKTSTLASGTGSWGG